MRILCLHGYGTSGAILKGQLDAFIRHGDDSHEFIFLDGEHECTRATGIGSFTPGPFLCFNKTFGPRSIQSSLEHLQAFIDDEGPFDGILGFSQGGSLALTYLLTEALTAEPGSEPTFKFAVFFSTIVAFSPDSSFCSDILRGLTDPDRQVLQGFPYGSKTVDYGALSQASRSRLFFEMLGPVLEISLEGGFIAPDTELGLSVVRSPTIEDSGLDELPRPLHPALLPVEGRVRIPTVHVVGKSDHQTLVEMSRLMMESCDPDVTRMLTHSGGHEPPRGAKDVKSVWAAVEWAIGQSSRQTW